MKRGSLALALVLILGTLLGSAGSGIVVRAQTGASDWPMVGGGPARTGEASGAGPVTNPAVIWRYMAPPDGFGPWPTFSVVADGTVFFPTDSYRGDVVALDGATGAERWRADIGFYGTEFNTGGDFAVADGLLYLVAADGPDASSDSGPPMAVVALDAATGAERWRFSYGFDLGEVELTPAEGAVYLTGHAPESEVVIALDGQTGVERWRTPADQDFGSSGPTAVVGGIVYVSQFRYGSSNSGFVVGFDAATGAERVRAPFAGFPFGAPAVSGGIAYVKASPEAGGSGVVVYALDMTAGAERWHAEFNGDGESNTLVVAGGFVYVTTMVTAETVTWTVHALDAANGQERWAVPGASAGAFAGGVLYGGAGDELVALDAATGQERWRLPVDAWRVAVAEGWLFVSGRDGHSAIGQWSGQGTPVPVVIADPGEGPDGGETDGPLELTPPDIAVVNADGSNLTSLAPGEHPVWSPDGTRIAYEGMAADETDIWIMNADGSGQVRVAPVPGWDSLPSWSPDGTKIAFVNGYGDLYVVGADGSGLRKLTSLDGPMSGPSWGDPFMERPSWSADGTRIAYASTEEGGPEIWVIDADGTDKTRLTNAPSLGIGDVYGEEEAYGAEEDDAYVEDESPDPPSEDELGLEDAEMIATGPAWSPDGSKIACVVLVPDGEGGIGAGSLWVMNADGSDQRQITDMIPQEFAPVWSPDGTKLLFVSWYDDSEEMDLTDLYVVNVDGTGLTKLTKNDSPDYDPVWSPDGTKIAFSSLTAQGFGLFTINSDGSGMAVLVDLPGEEFSSTWSPDGAKIAFVASQPSSEGGD